MHDMTTIEAADLLGVTSTTMIRWRAAGRGPEPIKTGLSTRSGHSFLYTLPALLAHARTMKPAERLDVIERLLLRALGVR